jgi:sortase (surface protein transpeptidase)
MTKSINSQIPKFLIALGVLILLTGLIKGYYQYAGNRHIVKQNMIRGITPPSTRKITPSEFDSYTVPANNPRYIFIPSIDVKAMVKPLGLTKNNQIQSPSNVYDAGWFKLSNLPGKPGAMLVDGHISSWTSKGIFYNLKSLNIGQTIVIEKGDGIKIKYKVIRSKTYDASNVDMQALLNPVNPNKPGLNLITCTGNVIKGTSEFDSRLIVFSELE